MRRNFDRFPDTKLGELVSKTYLRYFTIYDNIFTGEM